MNKINSRLFCNDDEQRECDALIPVISVNYLRWTSSLYCILCALSRLHNYRSVPTVYTKVFLRTYLSWRQQYLKTAKLRFILPFAMQNIYERSCNKFVNVNVKSTEKIGTCGSDSFRRWHLKSSGSCYKQTLISRWQPRKFMT